MSLSDDETDDLLRRARQGDCSATELLMERHRDRLRRMVQLRIDPRLAARMDPSDVVQEALGEAAGKLDNYLQTRNCPFYPWLRQIAWEQLVRLHRRHVVAKRRSVTRESRRPMELPDESAVLLADQFVASGTSPSGRLLREELRIRVQKALDQLKEHDREILVLHHLEQLTLKEAAAVLGKTEAAVQSRYRRAAERLHHLLQDNPAEDHR